MSGFVGTDLGLTAPHACACCASSTQNAAPSSTDAGSVVQELRVEGMTCAHCVASVSEELSALEGVQSVSVELNAGGVSLVRVSSATPLGDEQVRGAVDEAGFVLVGAS